MNKSHHAAAIARHPCMRAFSDAPLPLTARAAVEKKSSRARATKLKRQDRRGPSPPSALSFRDF